MSLWHRSHEGMQMGALSGVERSRSIALQIEGGEDEGEGTTPQRYNVTYMAADYTLGNLYDMWKKNAITMPELRRGYAWTPVQASRLIESFMMDLPVPPVFLMMDREENALVIDGMQRLLTIFYFFDGCYGKREYQKPTQEFRIVGINKDNEIYGKLFDDLPEYIRRELKSQLLRSILIEQDPPGDDDIDSTVAYHIFERLNTSGTPLHEQEIRNCVYTGKMNDLLHDFNNDRDWRKILGSPYLDPRMNDLQLALRCVALFHHGDRYKAPMKDFLSGFMHDMRNPTDDFILQEKERLGDVCRGIVDHLGERPFHSPNGALRAPLLDAVFVAFAHSIGDAPGDVRDRFEDLKKDPLFKPPFAESGATASAVEKRLEVASKVLFG